MLCSELILPSYSVKETKPFYLWECSHTKLNLLFFQPSGRPVNTQPLVFYIYLLLIKSSLLHHRNSMDIAMVLLKQQHPSPELRWGKSMHTPTLDLPTSFLSHLLELELFYSSHGLKISTQVQHRVCSNSCFRIWRSWHLLPWSFNLN